MWPIAGHPAVLAALDRALRSERPAHAYAFVGPEDVGKAATALAFAAALNCEADDKPCGECRPCRDTLAGHHPDVEFVAPGGFCDEPEHRDHAESRDVRICQVRRLERVISLSSYNGGRRVAIVDAADTLRTESANAFLKTLEEPPPGSVIILLIEREERLPETVLSRCQRLNFRRVDRETISSTLSERGATPEVSQQITAAAEGRIGWALRALEDPSLLSGQATLLDEALRVAHGSRAERFAWARRGESRDNEARARIAAELSAWQTWWRDVLLASTGSDQHFLNQDRAPVLAEEGKLYSAGAIVTFLKSLSQTREYLEANVDPQLALENLVLDMPVAGPLSGSRNNR